MGIEEGEEVQTKGIENMLNTITVENISVLEKQIFILVQEVFMTLSR
jgi:hypothetical protein